MNRVLIKVGNDQYFYGDVEAEVGNMVAVRVSIIMIVDYIGDDPVLGVQHFRLTIPRDTIHYWDTWRFDHVYPFISNN